MRQDSDCKAKSGTTWVNVDIAGSVRKGDAFRLQDDFHAAVNAKWLASAKIKQGNSSESSFWERMREVQAQVEDLLEDASVKGHEADLVHRLYDDVLNMRSRDKLGVEPIRGIFERVRAISSLEELSALLTDPSCPPLTAFSSFEVFADKKDSENYVVYVDRSGLTLTDADEYKQMTEQGKRMREADRAYHLKMLGRLGVEEDQAQEMDLRLFALESDIAKVCLGSADRARDDYEEITYNARTSKELQDAAANYPLMGVLAAKGLAGSNKFVLGEPEWLGQLDSLYKEDRLEDFKAAMLIHLTRRFGSLLDSQAYEDTERWKNERIGSVGAKPLKRSAYDICNSLLGMAVGKMYIGRYFPQSTKAQVEKMIGEITETYRERLSGADWLSQATRQAACEKLDALTARVGYPQTWPEYEKLSFEGCDNLVEICCEIASFERRRESAKVNRPVDRGEWLMNPHEVNAYYLPTDNSINIPAGILGGVFYPDNSSQEDIYGGIGIVIGHEITHAFDKNGSLYDKHGNLGNSWWTDSDRAEFKKRTDWVANYWNGMEVLPGLNLNGDMCVTEIVADMGGAACMTEIGQHIEGFDFAAMYKAYARVWRCQESEELAQFLLINDVHAPAHLRTNGTLQQLDKFHEAFCVSEGDGMYLAPERRQRIW